MTAFVCGGRFEHEAVASLLLERSIALDADIGKHVDRSVGRLAFVKYFGRISRMEMHAHVPKLGKTLGHWLLEGLFIVISVALGFWVTQVREERQGHELAARVLTGLQAEVQHNLATVEPFIDIQLKWIDAMGKFGSSTDRQTDFPVCPTSSTACGMFFATRPDLGEIKTNFPIFRRAAWDTALSTGALRLVDYDLAAGLSEIYQMQDLFKSNLEKVGPSSTDWFDPAARDAAARKTYMAMVEVLYDERQLLLPLYRKYLPLIAAAVGQG